MKKIELLSPAGGMKQYISAVNNGADAIYIGGPLFNARMNATNFTLDEIKEAVDFGHLRNVKTYVTMNTLLYNEELYDALDYANKLYNIGVDALIIQDLGLGKLLHENIPSFELHLSTQASVYNSLGVEAAKELGYKRVVLARECNLDEIKSCISKDNPEIEVFVHGALCMCYSGQCQLSREIGGRSGNRGECAQPCRLPYIVNNKEEYLLSPKDLCYLPYLDKLIDMGVSSLKIEGRMKSPEYVGVVTRIYRKYIDLYYKTGKLNIEESDLTLLNQIFNRGGFTSGYLLGDPKLDILSGSSPKNQGVEIGKAISNKGIYLEAKLNKEIKMGDVIELEKSHESFKVTYLKKEKDKYILGDLKGDILNDEKIFRLVSKDLNDNIRLSFENEKNFKRVPIDISIFLYINHPIKITVKALNRTVSLESDYIVQASKSNTTSEDEIKEKLSKLGNTPFIINRINIKGDSNIFIPISKLNEIRRDAIKLLISDAVSSYRHNNTIDSTLTIDKFTINLTTYDLEMDNSLVVLPQVTKGSYDDFLINNLEKFKKDNIKVLVHNISWIKPFSNLNVTVYGGYGLNILNSETVKAYKLLGMSDYYMGSLELAIKDDFKEVPLMVTEHEIPIKEFTDRKGEKYVVEYNKDINKSFIFKK